MLVVRMLWCWRCKSDQPMLDENEWADVIAAVRITSAVAQPGTNFLERQQVVADVYERHTGVRMHPNVVWHAATWPPGERAAESGACSSPCPGYRRASWATRNVCRLRSAADDSLSAHPGRSSVTLKRGGHCVGGGLEGGPSRRDRCWRRGSGLRRFDSDLSGANADRPRQERRNTARHSPVQGLGQLQRARHPHRDGSDRDRNGGHRRAQALTWPTELPPGSADSGQRG
jgi:hypothetical protein